MKLQRINNISLAAFIAVMLLCGISACYSIKTAQKEFGRAATTYPQIPADYCARVYPPQIKVTPGRDSIIFDTIYSGDPVYLDTIILTQSDTVFKILRLQGPTLLKTIIRTDTIFQENRAALDLCDQDRHKAIAEATDWHREAKAWKDKARGRIWIIWALLALILAYTAYRSRKIFWRIK